MSCREADGRAQGTLLANAMGRRIGSAPRAGTSPAPTMVRLRGPGRRMGGATQARALQGHSIPDVIRQQSLYGRPSGLRV